MTLDMIKPKLNVNVDPALPQAGIDALVACIAVGTVKDVHSAVECVNNALGSSYGGSVVSPYFNALHSDLAAYNAEADRLAREGKSVPEIFAALEGFETHFTVANLQLMKIEVYGSLDAWVAAMSISE